MRFALSEIASLTGASPVRWPGPVGGLFPVSEPALAGPGTIFFPVYRSETTDAAIERLARQGAAGVALFGDTPVPPAERHPGLGVVTLPFPFGGYKALAAEARRRSAAMVIGVTGSSGKSTTKEFLVHMLGVRRPVLATRDSHNLLSDCAHQLLCLSGDPREAAVIEMGFGWEGDIERMAALARPSAGIILKVTAAHLDGAGGSWLKLIEEKGRLGVHIPRDGFLAVHAEDPGCARLPYDQYQARILRFGAGPTADVRYTGIRCSETGTDLTLHLFRHRFSCRLQAYGAFQAANAAAAALVGHVAGLSPDEIRRGLEMTPPVPRRFQVHRYNRGVTVVDDSFNVTVDGMLRGLENAALLAGTRRRMAVLSGVGRLDQRTAGFSHRIIGKHVVTCGFERVVLVQDDWSDGIRQGLLEAGMPPDRVYTVACNAELPEQMLPLTGPDQLVYCKARYAGEAIDTFRTGLAGLGFEPV